MREPWNSAERQNRTPQFDLDPRDEWMLLSAGLTLAGCVFWSSFVLRELFPVMLHVLAFVCGIFACAIAFLTGQKVFASHFTAWDQAALYFAVALFAGSFADISATMELLDRSMTVATAVAE